MESTHRWVQVELKLCPGAELWLMLRHRNGHFRLPAHASILDGYEGAKAGWTITPRKAWSGDVTVRVPLGYLRELQERAGGTRRLEVE